MPTGTTHVDAPTEVLQRVRENSARPAFDHGEFLDQIELSPLKPGVRQTMAHTALHSDSRGIVNESGRSIANTLGCRQATVSTHWGSAREAGYLVSRRRFNAASVQRLTWPTGDQSVPAQSDAHTRPLRAVEWTHAEREWFANLDPGKPAPGPWGNDEPPF